MPSATASPNAPTPRIPAWKRLGLKLRSAQESQVQIVPGPVVESAKSIRNSKRSRVDVAEDISPTKRVKKSSKVSPHQVEPPKQLAVEHSVTITPKLARKKSVTFTPETKAEDGDSIKQLFNAWVAEQKAQDPSIELRTSVPVFSTPEPPVVDEKVDAQLDESERRVKRVNKQNQRKAIKSQDASPLKKLKPSDIRTHTHTDRPFLAYLRQYHDSRETWKFNKNHQNHLMKHIFNIDVIPSDHAHLIYEYVRGLKGGVRSRLRDAALAVKVKDQEDGAAGFPETMADAQKRQREYEAAMREYVATMTAANASSKMGYEEGVLLGLSDAAMHQRAAKRLRAEQIMAELVVSQMEQEDSGIAEGSGATEDDDSQKRLRMNDGSTQKVTRRRKQRTVPVGEDSSSSEESSDSDDDSSDESGSNNNAPAESSSSSSSSSSSESDGDEESEDEESEEESEESDSE